MFDADSGSVPDGVTRDSVVRDGVVVSYTDSGIEGVYRRLGNGLAVVNSVDGGDVCVCTGCDASGEEICGVCVLNEGAGTMEAEDVSGA
mgnify:CR=1 FL=1